MLPKWVLAVMLAVMPPAVACAQTSPDPAPSQSEARLVQRVWAAMRLGPLLPVIRDEALAQADEMADAMFEDGASPGWHATVARLHDPAGMAILLRAALEEALDQADPALIGAALDFYDTAEGQRFVNLELSARKAMVDPDIEAAARETMEIADAQGNPRLALIDELIAAADLTEPNVAGALNAALAFTRAFQQGGGAARDLSERQMLAETWAQEPEMRADLQGWMRAFLMLAYSPADDAALRVYIDFAGSPPGQAMGNVMFAAFDVLFRELSHQMGLAAAAEIRGRRL